MSRPPMKPNTRKRTSAERRAIWSHRFKLLLQVALGLAIVAGSAWGGRALYGVFRSSPYLHVQSLHIEGNTRAKAQDLYLLAGPIEGIHLLDLHLEWARESVIKHPWVKDASLEINLPDEVVLRVVEEEPVALLMAGDLYYLDGDGRPFVKVKPGELVDLPILTGLEDREHLLRRDGALGVRALRYGLDLMSLLENEAPELGPVSEVHISLDEGFSFFLEDGSAEVLLGFEEFGIKLERLALLREREGIDLMRVGRVNLDLERAAVVTALPSRVHRR